MTLDEANMTIDYLKEIQKGYIEGEGYERHPLPEWYALEKAIQTIEQTTWIPVSERLPDKNTWVFTCYRMGNDKIDIDIKKINRWNGQWEDEFDYCNTVIAWMPLPQGYREVEE